MTSLAIRRISQILHANCAWVAALVGLMVCASLRSSEASAQGKRSPRVGFLYFRGLDELGNAYFVSIDTEVGQGRIYHPPYGVDTLLVQRLPHDHWKISTLPQEDFDGFTFVGRCSGDSLIGMVERYNTYGRDAYDVSGTLILQTVSLLDSNAGAVYSNVEYNEEGGDLLGDEVLVANTVSGPLIMLCVCEGEPENLVFATDIKKKNASILFTTPDRQDDSLFTITVLPKTLKLTRRTAGNIGTSTLKRKQGVLPLMAIKGRSTR